MRCRNGHLCGVVRVPDKLLRWLCADSWRPQREVVYEGFLDRSTERVALDPSTLPSDWERRWSRVNLGAPRGET
jgi:hypothetical protein